MTFKHIDFEDSPVMRNLEKIAVKKGIVKDTLLDKIASRSAIVKKADLTPTNNLFENLVKLCAGLRENGFDKQADEFEKTLMQYKKAETLYETSKETGEDLVDAAHPEGSHKMEGMSGDSEIETIIDQHLKMLKVVEKKPTGKLSNAKEIINAVKMCLAEEIDFEQLQNKRKQAAATKMVEISKLVIQIKNELSSKEGNLTKFNISKNIKQLEDELTIAIDPNQISVSIISDIKTDLYDIKNSLSIFKFQDTVDEGHFVMPWEAGTAYHRYLSDFAEMGAGVYDSKKRDQIISIVNMALSKVKEAENYFKGFFDDKLKSQEKKPVSSLHPQPTITPSNTQDVGPQLPTKEQLLVNLNNIKPKLNTDKRKAFWQATESLINSGDLGRANNRINSMIAKWK